jgi:hypothetical protein
VGILDDEGSASDADFFSQIRLDRTGLEAVREAAAAGSWPQASEELARYFLQRKAPRWYFDWRFRTEPVTAHWDRRHTWGTPQLVPLAERTNALLEDVFVDGNGGRHDVSDMERFIASKPRHGEKSQHVTMFIWATDLGVMYARTRDSRYARKLVELFRAYNRAFPRRVTNTNPENPWLDESHPPGWHEMFVGKAAMHMVATLYTGILHDPSVTLGDVYILIKKLWFYAAQFTRFTKVETYKHYNHHWYERGACPFMLGLMFPEFEGFEAMRERGREVINQHLELDFFDDGSYLEHSTCYNAGTMGADLLVPWTCAFANDFPLIKPENLGHVRSWLSWCAGLTRPDGVLPAIGDEFDSTPLNRLGRGAVLLGDPGLKGFSESLNALAGGAEALGYWADNVLGLEECLLPAWEALPSDRPSFASAVFPDGGWVALRDSWEPDAMYFALSAIRPPMGANHGHWDLLHFLAYARGRSFIADPASWIYNGYYTAERRGYLYSMESHNVLTIDEDPLISKRELYSIWTGDVPECTVAEWSLGEEADFVSAYHDGYVPQRHTREVLFVKGKYWLIVDHVSNPDLDWEHTYRRLLHLDFGVELSDGGDRLVAQSNGEALTVVPFASGDQEFRQWRDEYLEPEREKLGKTALPWVAEVRSRATGPTVMAMLLYAHHGDDVPMLGLRPIEVEGNGGAVPASEAIALEVETPEGCDVWYRSFGTGGEMRFGDHRSDARAWLHLGAADRSIAIETTVRGDTREETG